MIDRCKPQIGDDGGGGIRGASRGRCSIAGPRPRERLDFRPSWAACETCCHAKLTRHALVGLCRLPAEVWSVTSLRPAAREPRRVGVATSANACTRTASTSAMESLDKLTAAGLPVFDLNSEALQKKDWCVVRGSDSFPCLLDILTEAGLRHRWGHGTSGPPHSNVSLTHACCPCRIALRSSGELSRLSSTIWPGRRHAGISMARPRAHATATMARRWGHCEQCFEVAPSR